MNTFIIMMIIHFLLSNALAVNIVSLCVCVSEYLFRCHMCMCLVCAYVCACV